jgi:hypothetical protein
MTEPTMPNAAGHLPVSTPVQFPLIPSPPSGAPSEAQYPSATLPLGGRSGRSRSGVVTTVMLTIYSLVVGNPLSTRAVFELTDLRRAYLRSVVVTYTKLSLPSGRQRGPGREFWAKLFWPGTEGPRALQTFGLRREETAHWLAQDVRTVLMVALGGLFIHLTLRGRSGGGFVGRSCSAWGALMIAGAVSGVVSNAVFMAAGGRTMYLGNIDGLITGAGLGAMFGFFVCWPVALIAAAVHRTHR